MSDITITYAQSSGLAHGTLANLPHHLTTALADLDKKDIESAWLRISQTLDMVQRSLTELEEIENRRNALLDMQHDEIKALLAFNAKLLGRNDRAR